VAEQVKRLSEAIQKSDERHALCQKKIVELETVNKSLALEVERLSAPAAKSLNAFPSLGVQPAPHSAPNRSTGRMTYAQVVVAQLAEAEGKDKEAAIKAFEKISRQTPVHVAKERLAAGRAANVDPAMMKKLRRVYVSGFNFILVRELRKALTEIGFAMRKIIYLNYIGRALLEFLVEESYEETFVKLMEGMNKRVLQRHDPVKALDPLASEETKKRVLAAFKARLQRIMDSPSATPLVKAFYAEWLERVKTQYPDPESHASPATPAPAAPSLRQRSRSTSAAQLSTAPFASATPFHSFSSSPPTILKRDRHERQSDNGSPPPSPRILKRVRNTIVSDSESSDAFSDVDASSLSPSTSEQPFMDAPFTILAPSPSSISESSLASEPSSATSDL